MLFSLHHEFFQFSNEIVRNEFYQTKREHQSSVIVGVVRAIRRWQKGEVPLFGDACPLHAAEGRLFFIFFYR